MVYDLEKNDLDWVIPRAKEINLSGKFRNPEKILTINIDKKFSPVKSKLNNILENFLPFKWDSSENANLIIKENTSLGEEQYSLEILEEKLALSVVIVEAKLALVPVKAPLTNERTLAFCKCDTGKAPVTSVDKST